MPMQDPFAVEQVESMKSCVAEVLCSQIKERLVELESLEKEWEDLKLEKPDWSIVKNLGSSEQLLQWLEQGK